MVSTATWTCISFLLWGATTLQQTHGQSMSCTYGPRGSLTSTCVHATPMYFRTTSYRFDNLDETVRCLDCNLQTIESNTFDISGNQIQTLDLTSAKISVLKPKAFMGLVFLTSLLMPHNSISQIPTDTFQGVSKVGTLNLEDNSITRLIANAFRDLSNLKQLNLNRNRIQTIENGAFEGLIVLEELDLGNNEITTMKDAFNNLHSVLKINLENNKIADINSMDVKDVDSLLQLNLAKNAIKAIPESAFLSFSKLEKLNLSSNPLENLTTNSFRGLVALENLYMNHCALKAVEKGHLQSLRQLRKLDMSNNQLNTFQTGVFSGLPELRTLNLSHNVIEKYWKTGIFPLHGLHTLDLSYNKLTDIDYRILIEHMPALAYLELDGNPWHCYLGKEMEEFFKHDNFVFSVGKEFENVNLKCNDSGTSYKQKPEEMVSEQTQLVSESNGHEYVLYIFICLTLGCMGFLFYMQYRNQREIQEIVGKSNVSEVQLLTSSDMDARDDF